MKQENARSRRIRIIAAVCAMVVLSGGSAGVLAMRSKTHAQSAQTESTEETSAEKADDGIISAGGTVTASQLGESLGLENTAVKLTVGAVLIESGDQVTVGSQLYEITADSLTKAEKTLNNELQSAKSALLEQNISYIKDKNEAYLLYQSQLLLGSTAQSDYDTGMGTLDSDLQKAYDSYQEAVSTIDSVPGEIAAKQTELGEKQSLADTLQQKKDSLQGESDSAKEKLSSAAVKYNSAAAEYNAAAGTVRYLGNALGKDTSGYALAGSISADVGGSTAPETDAPEPSGQEMVIPDGQSFDMSGMMPVSFGASGSVKKAVNPGDDPLNALYESAVAEYETQKELLGQAEAEYAAAEEEYGSVTQSLSECTTELKTAQDSVSALEKEISELETKLSNAKSERSKLLSEYNKLSASYSTDQLELKNKLDTDNASCANAEYHYQITLATIEDDLAEAQAAYDTAEENLRIFNEELAGGYICAKQDGIVYSANCQEGRNVNVGMPVVYYVDESSCAATVELGQNDVTQVSIGDTVLIYSSETGIASGKITAISAGTSTSLADVRFNVTVEADAGAALYSGESVNVYFNYSDMRSSDFSDFKGSSGGERPDFSGGMPEGFDPSSMPDFGARKEN